MQGLYNILNISAEPECVNQGKRKRAVEWNVLHRRFGLEQTAWIIPRNKSDARACFRVQAWFGLLGNTLWNRWQHSLLTAHHVCPEPGGTMVILGTVCCPGIRAGRLWSCIDEGSPFCFCELVIESWVTQSPLIHPLKYSSVPSLCCLLCSFHLNYLPVVLV